MKTIHILAACSGVKVDADESGTTWFQTFPPPGRYPVGGTIKGAPKEAEYLIDEKAVRAIMESFMAAAKRDNFSGLLVDREHFSLDPEKPSDAMAWAKDIRLDPDGSLWTRWEFTSKGRELWEGKVLVNRSPAFYSEKVDENTYRPIELISIAMTNTPHFHELSTLAAARAAEVTNQEKETRKMNKIITELGLAEGASEDDVVAAIKQLKTQASAAESKASECQKECDKAKAECRRMQCDQFMAANKDRISDAAACREAFMQNPELAMKIVGACKAASPAQPQRVLSAATSIPAVSAEGHLGTCREQMASLDPSRRAAFYEAHKADIDAGN